MTMDTNEDRLVKFRGKALADMSREELIECAVFMARRLKSMETENTRLRHKDTMNNLMSSFDRFRR